MKLSHVLFSLVIITAFSFGLITEASCLLDPNNGSGCNYSMQYVPMIDIPGVTTGSGVAGTTSFASYVGAIYSVAIVLAALLAVIRLVIAGAKYMMTDVVSGKGEAINDIKNSLLGLLIIISAFVILNTINPNLTKIVIAPNGPYIGGVSNNGLINSNGGGTTTLPVGGAGGNLGCASSQIPCGNQCFNNPGCNPQTQQPSCTISPTGVPSYSCVVVPGTGTPGSQTATKNFFCAGGAGGCANDADWNNSASIQNISGWCSGLGSGNGKFTINPINSQSAVATCTYQP